MASTVLYAKDFEGYIPLIDPRRMAKPTVINGSNWLFDDDGPRSAFGTKFANFVQYDSNNRIKPSELRVGGEIWYGTTTGIYRHDPTSGMLQPMLVLNTISNLFWPWSSALCGGKYYFAQYGIGLWEWDPVLQTMTKISTPIADANIKFVSASQGRLLMLGIGSPSDIYTWSSLDNGRDFVPSLTTSAGADSCARTGGTGYRIDAVADGFIVATSKGLIKATFVGTNYLWQHRVLSYEINIFSPNCAAWIPDTGMVYVDRKGMYITNGAVPQPWEPLMGEYFKKNALTEINVGQFGCIQVAYSYAMKAVAVSFASSTREGSFSTTYVWLSTSQKWGTFNRTSWGLFDVILPVSGLEYFAYMDFEGYIQYFLETYQCDTAPIAPFALSDVVWRPLTEPTMTTIAGVQTFTTVWTNPNYDAIYYTTLGQVGTYYPDQNPLDENVAGDFSPDPGSDGTTFYTNWNIFPEGPVFLRPTQYTLPQLGLNSFIEVGPFRFTEQKAADETSMLESVVVGVTPVGAFVAFEDWNLLFGNEDWNVDTGDEDWGAGAGTPDNFNFQLSSTNDGTSVGAQGPEELYVVNNMGGALMYTPQGWSGIWHKFKVAANDPGQGYALKYIDLAGQLTGRMTING